MGRGEREQMCVCGSAGVDECECACECVCVPEVHVHSQRVDVRKKDAPHAQGGEYQKHPERSREGVCVKNVWKKNIDYRPMFYRLFREGV